MNLNYMWISKYKCLIAATISHEFVDFLLLR